MIRRLWLALHRLDAHFGGRCCNRHIRQRQWLTTVAQSNGNANRRRNQQRSPAGNYYQPFCHR